MGFGQENESAPIAGLMGGEAQSIRDPELFCGPRVERIRGIKVVTWDRESSSQRAARSAKKS